MPTDVGEEAACRALVVKAVERFSGVDVLMSAAECARLVVRAMERRQRMLVMSFKGKLGRWAKLIAPGLVDRMAAEAVRKGE